MAGHQQGASHSAEAAALGFYYQAFFALLTLMRHDTDSAAVGIEQLDDVSLKVDGHKLLYQLKHSLSNTPPPISIKSKSLWKTVKVWVDILPELTLSETTLHLVTVAKLGADSPLILLTDLASERTELVEAMTQEAQRVLDARAAAAKASKALPHGDRADGCSAFLGLTEIERLNLMRRTVIQPGSPTLGAIEDRVAGYLKLLPPDHRPTVATRLVEWWDRQIVYSLCGKRPRVFLAANYSTRSALLSRISSRISLCPTSRWPVHPGTTSPMVCSLARSS